MTTRRLPAGALLAALAVAALTLTGCSNPPPTPRSEVSAYYEAEFEQARQEATTDLEHKILEDDVITRDEYLEAKNLVIECIRSNGLTAELMDMGSGIFQMAVGGSWDEDLVHETMLACESSGFAAIEGLYSDMIQNPEKRNLDDLAAECLLAVGLVDEPFTGRDYERESNTSGFMTRVMGDPEGAKCMQDPSYHTGSGTR
ncbi:hypothetical protein [Microbacterium sp. NIBRBAC000506063]|uniref:hypothetical protein n=1 Tax=Microbacterium sp. NIBRBAC000506063 TaxID=2734618 RepID=UPI001BB6F2F4|nr:hypothetical protein [Microbacterium sp. NIBRBAC000506063]QTV79158.1 hypothetical protein KAE78_08735 [Microbacterium sp. NIBRBAC000506063]